MKAEHLKDFDYSQADVIHFEFGIPGFEEYKDYVIMYDEEYPFIMTLQSVDSEHPSLVVIDPYTVFKDYSPILSEQDKEYFANSEDLKYLLVTVVTENISDSVTNLKSPIVIDTKTNKAKQVFLENEYYSFRHKLFSSDQ